MEKLLLSSLVLSLIDEAEINDQSIEQAEGFSQDCEFDIDLELIPNTFQFN